LPSGADFSVSPLLTDPGTSAFVTDVLAAAAAAASPFPASYKDIKKMRLMYIKLLRLELCLVSKNCT